MTIRYTQNFLKSTRLVERLLDKTTIGPDDVVVEVGPGKGRITSALAARCRCVVAIELDPWLVGHLRSWLESMPNVVLYQEDALTFPLPAGPYKVFSSIPFNVTASLVTKLTGAANPPDDAYLLMQREAADRILGDTLFGLLLRPWFEPSVLHRFSPGDFDPPPGVDVVMLRLQKRGPPLVPDHHAALFRDFMVYRFSRRRRPRDLGFEQWLQRFQQFVRMADAVALRRIAGAAALLQRQQKRLPKRHRTTAPRRRAGSPKGTTGAASNRRR